MIFLTGASGNVGTAVARCLHEARLPFRIGARDPRAASPPGGTATVAFDFLDPQTFRAAVRGCDSLFLLRPPAVSDTRRTLNPFVDVGREEGIKQIVFVSVAGAADNSLVPHHAVEQHLRRGPAGWTILRPGFFAQNFGGPYRDDIVLDARVFVPAGRGRVTFVDVRDVAEVAAAALVDPAAHQGRAYTLVGPEALSFAEAAALLSREIGRSIHYQPASILGYLRHLRRRRMPIAQILVQAALHAGLRLGQAATLDGTLASLLAQPPRTLGDYFRDHRDTWA
jgi:uncharacterized protein YbjT (DUF2867 family)